MLVVITLNKIKMVDRKLAGEKGSKEIAKQKMSNKR